MRWLRQHSEDGRVLVVTRVGAGARGYTITLVHGASVERAETIASSYASREGAFAAADAIVRSRYGGHACSRSCSVWAEDAETR